MNVASSVARATVITAAQRVRKNIHLVNVQCSAYQMIVTAVGSGANGGGDDENAPDAEIGSTVEPKTTSTALEASKGLLGQKVLHVPLGSVVTARQARKWRIEWHCCDAKQDGTLLRVVPRLIDGFWSQGAIVQHFAPEQMPTEEQYAAGVEHILYAYTVALPCEISPDEPRPFVDLLQNRTLIRALMRVRVVVHFVPAISAASAEQNESMWHSWRDSDTAMQFSAIWHGEYRKRALVYDAKTESGTSLSAQQLLRLSKRPNCQFLLLPLLSKDNETLYSFVTHNESLLQRRNASSHSAQREAYRHFGGSSRHGGSGGGGGDASRSSNNRFSLQQSPPGEQIVAVGQHRSGKQHRASSSFESERQMSHRYPLHNNSPSLAKARRHKSNTLGQNYNDIDDCALDSFAQRLLYVVDRSVPSDAVGIIIRPFDLEATAYVEQKCPYMLCKVAAFVPALSRLWPRPTRQRQAESASRKKYQ